MQEGYVYVLHNCEHKQPTVKIGFTTRAVEQRVRELDTTGSPGEFVPLFRARVSDAPSVERRVHERLAAYRIRSNREFFRVAPETAIRVLIEEAEPDLIVDAVPHPTIDVLPSLARDFAALLDSRFGSIVIEAADGTVVLTCRTRRSDDLVDETIERVDLNVIVDGSGSRLFDPKSLEAAAETFLELDPYTLIMTTPVFAQEWATVIADLLEGRRDRSGSWDDADASRATIRALALDVARGITDHRTLIRRNGQL